MAKFGEIINTEVPVLICFYANWGERNSNNEILNEVVSLLTAKVKVIKINIEKNQVLTTSLCVNESPSFIIYKKGVMVWRGAGNQNTSELINLIKEYF